MVRRSTGDISIHLIPKDLKNRNAEPYRKGDNYEVLEAYYNTLNENPETISQFNHPEIHSVISWISLSMIRSSIIR